MDSNLKTRLQQDGFHELFPVQVCAWEKLCGKYQGFGGRYIPHDYFICAPTGSGKTLAYTLPTLQLLSRFPGNQLRAIVVLPSKDLAAQVWEVMGGLCESVGLKVCLLNGTFSLNDECQMLSSCQYDIVVCTPGRLVLQINQSNNNLSLQSLQFLVIDEGDKLLKQSYQDWLPRVMEEIEDLNPSQDAVHGMVYGNTPRVIKLLISATLTQDPIKIQKLNLYNPRYVTADTEEGRYALPQTLSHFKVVCKEEKKSAYLVALLKELMEQENKVIVFASSVRTTHRLSQFTKELAEMFDGNQFVEYSSQLKPKQRQQNLKKFRRGGGAMVMFASDAMTRGIDVVDVTAVVNYDMPSFAKTYVHRAGRTARAGREGKVYTITHSPGYLARVTSKIDNIQLKKHKINQEWLSNNEQEIQRALLSMHQDQTTEKMGHCQQSQIKALTETVENFVKTGYGIA